MSDLSGPFLTDLDSRAQVKGSRDPLSMLLKKPHEHHRGAIIESKRTVV